MFGTFLGRLRIIRRLWTLADIQGHFPCLLTHSNHVTTSIHSGKKHLPKVWGGGMAPWPPPWLRHCDHINRSCSCRTRSIDHQRVRRYAPFHSIETCARMALRESVWMFFAYNKMLGRTEMRTRD